LIWVGFAKVEEGRRLRGLWQIRRGDDQPAHGSTLSNVTGRFLRGQGSRMGCTWTTYERRESEYPEGALPCLRSLRCRFRPTADSAPRWQAENHNAVTLPRLPRSFVMRLRSNLLPT
jgi:hypothetical protein